MVWHFVGSLTSACILQGGPVQLAIVLAQKHRHSHGYILALIYNRSNRISQKHRYIRILTYQNSFRHTQSVQITNCFNIRAYQKMMDYDFMMHLNGFLSFRFGFYHCESWDLLVVIFVLNCFNHHWISSIYLRGKINWVHLVVGVLYCRQKSLNYRIRRSLNTLTMYTFTITYAKSKDSTHVSGQ